MSLNSNTTSNGTQLSSNCYTDSTVAAKIGYTLAYCLIFVFCLVGNSFIGIVVYKTKTMRKPINFLIANMAMSDLLYPFFLIPERIQKFYVDSWYISGPLGQALCKLMPFFQDISAVVSFQSLVLIAVDRFGAVVFPFRAPLISSKLCPFFISATWIVAMATFSTDLLTFKVVEYPAGLKCRMRWNEVFGKSSSNENYLLAVYITFLFSPWVLVTILYAIILIKLKLQKIPGNLSFSAEQQRAKRERNVFKLAFAIVLVFAVCWLPFSVIVLLHRFVWDPSTTRLSCLLYFSIARFMAHAHCALNPCICFAFSQKYRQGIKGALSRVGMRERPIQNLKKSA